MPVLTALDECLATLDPISNHADLGLNDPSKRDDVLLMIKRCCDEIDETVRGVFEGLPEYAEFVDRGMLH